MQGKDVRCVNSRLYFLPVKTRIPLKFGTETLNYVTCARAALTVENKSGKKVTGWGETPLSVQWAWPGDIDYNYRHNAMKEICLKLAESWAEFSFAGHSLEIGSKFLEKKLPEILNQLNQNLDQEKMPWLAALICYSPFDIALHDAYAKIQGEPVYETYSRKYLNKDLSHFLTPAENRDISFREKYPEDFLLANPEQQLTAWHLVGGRDIINPDNLTGDEPEDGYPVLLSDWIDRDGLKCLKIKLKGSDTSWDYKRIVEIGRMARNKGVLWLSADFNCTVTDPDYVIDILERLKREYPRIYGMVLYVEQPFPYDLKRHKIDVHGLSSRKPLFMDESAHDWTYIKSGQKLGWNGVALKTCKTQTGAILSLCWARAHGMTIMVQDLTNPMLAQIPHVLLAAHADTIMGVETNSMQFYPEASSPEAKVHPGVYRRKQGKIDLSTISGSGFGYRLEEIDRTLPEPAITC
ncbi:MAG: enolase C-terminal domain-like protein [bacterium]